MSSAALVLALVVGAAPGGCKEPTQITLQIFTDVPCDKLQGVAITAGQASSVETAPPSTVVRRCLDGRIGEIAIFPASDDSAIASVKVVAGVARDAETCTPPQYDGCIVARRRIRFAAHAAATLPVLLRAGCRDVPCDPATTCGALGTCVAPDVDVEACLARGVCSVEQGVPVNPSGGDAGDAATPTSDAGSPMPETCPGGQTTCVAEISAGDSYTCARINDGRVKCWGLWKAFNDGPLAALGIPGPTNHGNEDPIYWGNRSGDMAALPFVNLGTGVRARSIVAGGVHACIITSDDRLKCWGRNPEGQLGISSPGPRGATDDTMGDALPFVDLGPGFAVADVALSRAHTCARARDGRVKCWGQGGDRLGLGDMDNRGLGPMGEALPAVQLGTGRTAKQIAAAADHTCALLDNDSLKCWGGNSYGELGVPSVNFNYENRGGRPNEMGDNLRATLFPAGRVPKSVHAQNDISCVIFTDGAVTCFGRASAGELGLESLNDRGKGANEMGPGTQFVNLGSGRTASDVRPGLGTVACGILDDSRFKCWGQGNLAQGTNMQAGHAAGTMGDALPPVFLGPGNSASRIQALTVGREHVCVLYPDRRVKCFGDAQCALGIDACRRLGATNDMLGDNVPFVSLL